MEAGPVPKRYASTNASATRSKRKKRCNGPCGGRRFQSSTPLQVILQIVTNRQRRDDVDAQFTQVIGRPDSGEHQQLRRIERTAAQDHFAQRFGRRDNAFMTVCDAVGFRAVEQHAARRSMREHGEVRALHDVPQERARSRVTAPVVDVELRASEPDAFGIVIRRARIAERHCGFVHRFFDRIVGLCKLDRQRTAAAAQRRLAAFPPLEALEIGQHVFPAPAGRAAPFPALEVAARTARQRHHVDRRRAAQHFSPQRHQLAPRHAFFGDGVVAPIEQPVLVQLRDADRHAQIRMRIVAARFEQQNARRGILCQAARKNAARRAGADDDVVEPITGGHLALATRGRVGGFTRKCADGLPRRVDRNDFLFGVEAVVGNGSGET